MKPQVSQTSTNSPPRRPYPQAKMYLTLQPYPSVVAANELGKEYPMAFGPNGGKSRALSITGVAYTMGSFIGPILAGTLTTQFGYYTMNCVIGEYLYPEVQATRDYPCHYMWQDYWCYVLIAYSYHLCCVSYCRLHLPSCDFRQCGIGI